MDTRRNRRSRDPEPQPPPPKEIVAPVWMAVSRSVAFFLGMVILLFLYGEIKYRGPDASIWWTYPLPVKPVITWASLSLVGFELILFSFLPKMSFPRRWITFTLVVILFAGALRDTWIFYQLLKNRSISSGFPIPYSFHIAASLTIVLPGIVTSVTHTGSFFKNFFIGSLSFVLCLVTFPLAMIYCVGQVNDQQKTTVAVIPGSTITSGKTSLQMIKERIQIGHQLYQEGRVKKIYFASGQKIDGKPEAEIMKELAIKLGVDPADILVENQSETFEGTIQETVSTIRENDYKSIMLVNQFPSIARTKLYYQREGVNVQTTSVPQKDKNFQVKILQQEAEKIVQYFLKPFE